MSILAERVFDVTSSLANDLLSNHYVIRSTDSNFMSSKGSLCLYNSMKEFAKFNYSDFLKLWNFMGPNMKTTAYKWESGGHFKPLLLFLCFTMFLIKKPNVQNVTYKRNKDSFCVCEQDYYFYRLPETKPSNQYIFKFYKI